MSRNFILNIQFSEALCSIFSFPICKTAKMNLRFAICHKSDSKALYHWIRFFRTVAKIIKASASIYVRTEPIRQLSIKSRIEVKHTTQFPGEISSDRVTNVSDIFLWWQQRTCKQNNCKLCEEILVCIYKNNAEVLSFDCILTSFTLYAYGYHLEEGSEILKWNAF